MKEYRLVLQLIAAINEIENTALLPLSKAVIERWLAYQNETWEIMKWQITFNPSFYLIGRLPLKLKVAEANFISPFVSSNSFKMRVKSSVLVILLFL